MIYRRDPDAEKRLVRLLVDLLLEAERKNKPPPPGGSGAGRGAG